MPKTRIGGKRVYVRKDGTWKGQEQAQVQEQVETRPAEKAATRNDVSTKQGLIEFIQHQTGYTLPNEEGSLNRRRYVLYTEIPRRQRNAVLTSLRKKGVSYEQHLGDNYFIILKR